MILGEFTLDPFQVQLVNRCRLAVADGKRKVCIALRTGGGKTLVSAAVMAGAIAKGKRCLFLANRRLLVGQKSKTLERCQLPHTIMMNGEEYSQWDAHRSGIVVASRDTFTSRVMKRGKLPLPDADVVIVDELHDNLSSSSELIYERYPEAVFVGLTATPARGDGRGLGKGWSIVPGPTHAELVAAGRLVDLADPCFAPAPPDLAGVPVSSTTKDYAISPLSEVMAGKAIVGDVVETWLKHGQNRPTVAFTCDIAHSKSVQQAFLAAGVMCGHVDNTTAVDDREAIYEQLRTGRISVLSNCSLLTTGWDYPGCNCAILARPTKSLVLYLQMVGRVLRSAPSKHDALLIDHGGNILRHGWPTIERDWPDSETEQVKPAAVTPVTPEVRHCPKCAAMWTAGAQCPNCGWKPQSKAAAAKAVVSGELVPVSSKTAAKKSQQSTELQLWFKVLAMCAHRGLTIRVARKIYHDQTGVWPDGIGPHTPSSQWDVKVASKFPGFINRKKRK